MKLQRLLKQRDGIYRERILGGTKLILFSQLDQLLITPKRGPEYLNKKITATIQANLAPLTVYFQYY